MHSVNGNGRGTIRRVKYLSLFSGIGGFELGINGRSECIDFSEVDKYAIQIYQRHFPKHKLYGEIRTIEAEASNGWNTNIVPDFDLLVGGFPCPAFQSPESEAALTTLEELSSLKSLGSLS